MTKKERLKVKDWVRRNLGKEVTYLHETIGGTERHNVMIVGYSELLPISEGEQVRVLVSYTDDRGWAPEDLDITDHLFVHSPLNVSFWIVGLLDIEEYIVDEYFDKGHVEQE